MQEQFDQEDPLGILQKKPAPKDPLGILKKKVGLRSVGTLAKNGSPTINGKALSGGALSVGEIENPEKLPSDGLGFVDYSKLEKGKLYQGDSGVFKLDNKGILVSSDGRGKMYPKPSYDDQVMSELLKNRVSHSPQTQADIERVAKLSGVDIEKELPSIIDDPVKAILNPFRNNAKKAFSDFTNLNSSDRNAAESVKQANYGDRTQINKAADLQVKIKRDKESADLALVEIGNNVYNKIIPNGKAAIEYLQNRYDAEGGKLPENNETVNLAINKANRYEELKNKVLQNPDLTQLAVDMARESDPQLNKQIGVLEKDAGFIFNPSMSEGLLKEKVRQGHEQRRAAGEFKYDKILPPEQQGAYVEELLNDPDIALIAEENPELKQQFEYLKNGGLYELYPERGEIVARNVLSREYELRKSNLIANPIFNKSEYLNKLSDEVFANNPSLKKIADERLKGNWEGKIDTKGIVDEFGTGAKHTYEGMAGTLKDLIGAGDTEAERIYKGLEQQHSTVSSGVKGWQKDLGGASNFLGMIGAMGTGGLPLKLLKANPAAVNAIVTTVTFGDQELNSYTMRYPGEPEKALFGAATTTLAYGLVAKAFPHAKFADAVAKKMEPSVVQALSKLEAGEVSSVVRDGLVKQYGKVLLETGKGMVEGTSHMMLVTAYQVGINEMMGLDEKIISQEFDAPDIARNMMIGLAFPSFVKAVGNKNVVGKSLVSIAENPSRYLTVLGEMKTKGLITELEFNKKAEDINFLSKTKDELSSRGILPKNQERFLLESMNEKYATETKPTEPTLSKKANEQIKEHQEIKEKILNGEDSDTIVTEAEQKKIDEQNENEIKLQRLEKDNELDNKKFDEQRKDLDGRTPDDRLKIEKIEEDRKRANEDFLLEKLRNKSATEGKKGTMQYFIDKAGEDPAHFMEVHDKKVTNQLLKEVPTEKLIKNRDYLVENFGESESTDYLSAEILSRQPKEEKSEVPPPSGSVGRGDVALGSVDGTAKELQSKKIISDDGSSSNLSDMSDLIPYKDRQEIIERIIGDRGSVPHSETISEAYHADKAAGKETELTQAVESLLGKQPPSLQQDPSIKEGASKGKVGEVEDIYFMTGEELRELQQETKAEQKQKLIDSVGKDWYDKYSLATNKEKSKMEDALTDEQKEVFGGVGLADNQNPEVIKDLRKKIIAIETTEDKEVLGSRVRQSVTDLANDRNNKEAIAVLNAAGKRAEELGFDKKEIQDAAISDLRERVGDEAAADILNKYFNKNEKATQISNTEKKEGTTNEKPDSDSEGAKEGSGEPPKPPEGGEKEAVGEGEGGKKELDKLANNVPDSGKVAEYMSKDTIEKYTGEEPTNDQRRGVQELEIALNHGEKIIEKAKELFGKGYAEKTLEYIDNSTAGVSNKALMYVSLENALGREKLQEPTRAAEITKQQALVYTQSQKFARENSLALNYQKLRKIAQAGYDIDKITDNFFSAEELVAKKELQKAIESDSDAINKEAEQQETGGMTPEVEKAIQEGVEKEVAKIYEAMPKGRQSAADRAIRALEAVQKKLRSRTYDAGLGVPVAIIDAGISTIKLALKAGVKIAEAIELGIAKIKEKYGKKWDNEDKFRKDMLEEYGKQTAVDTKQLVKDALIEKGFGREINVKGEKKQILDWKKLAGAAGTVTKISENVAEILKGKYSLKDIEVIKEELIQEYIDLRTSVIEKAQNELAKRNKETVTPDQKSAAKKLSELYTYGLFEQKSDAFENTLNKALGAKVSEKGFNEAKEIAKALETIYTNTFKGVRLSDISAKAAIEKLEDRLRILLFREAKSQGNGNLRAANIVRNYFEIQQTMILNNLKQAVENPFSGLQQKMIEKISASTSGESTKELVAQRRKMMKDVYKDMTLNGGIGYGRVESQFVNRQHIDDYVNKLSDSKLYHGIMSVVTGKATLNAMDAMFKAGITEAKFTGNLIKILTHPTNPKRMSKPDAVKFVSEKLTGQTFKDAQVTAKQVIEKINKDAGSELIPDNPQQVDRFANDIVKAALEMGGKITREQIEAAYGAAYKAAGLGLGHEANNILSSTIKGYSAKLEGDINHAIKDKEWNRAAALTIKSTLFRNIINPFVGGGTNWLVLKFEKTGIGLATGLMYKFGSKGNIDVSGSDLGMKRLEARLYNQSRYKDNFMRGLIGGAVTWLAYAAFTQVADSEEYRKWRAKNRWAARYLDIITPEPILTRMAIKDGKVKQYAATSFNRNDAFDATNKIIKGIEYGAKGDYSKMWGAFGEGVGSKFNAPVPWRLVKDGKVIYQGVRGEDPWHGNYQPSEGFLSGVLQGGVIEWLGGRPVSQSQGAITPEDEKKYPTFKEFSEKGINFPEFDPKKIQTKEVNGKIVERLSDYPKEVQDKYIETKKRYFNDELRMLQSGDYEVYRDADGTVHIKSKSTNISDMNYVPFKDLSKEDIQYLIGQYLSGNSTERTKADDVLKKW